MSETLHKNVDTWTKILGLTFILVSGVYALYQYKYAQEREFQKSFYNKQVDVVMEVFDTLSELDSATTEEERKRLPTSFG